MPGVEVALVIADLHLQLGKIDKGISRIADQWAKRPYVISFIDSITPGTAQVVLDGPGGGLMWNVTRISIGPPPGGVITTAGTFIVYRGSAGANAGIEVTRTTTVPNMLTFPRRSFTIRHPEVVWVAWQGGAAGATLVVDGQAEQFPTTYE
jgi:hypothetical protein